MCYLTILVLKLESLKADDTRPWARNSALVA
jgi:hypothetical protein